MEHGMVTPRRCTELERGTQVNYVPSALGSPLDHRKKVIVNYECLCDSMCVCACVLQKMDTRSMGN